MADAKFLTITLGRLIGGAILGASLTAAGVVGGMYFVIEMANSGLQAGMQSAIDSVNARIGDTNARFDRLEQRLDKVDDRLFDLTGQIAKGFTDTQQKLEKKASLDEDDLIQKFASVVRAQSGGYGSTLKYGTYFASASDFVGVSDFTLAAEDEIGAAWSSLNDPRAVLITPIVQGLNFDRSGLRVIDSKVASTRPEDVFYLLGTASP